MSAQQTRISLAEAATWPLDELDDTPIDCLDFTPAEAQTTVALWAWLVGSTYDEARQEVLPDGGLFVVLNRPASEFLEWFRRSDWEPFDRSQDDGTGWAWTVLDRARAEVAALGPMATQLPLLAPV